MSANDVQTALASSANFEQLLSALMSPDNQARSSAEAVFNACKEHALDALAGTLCSVLRTSGAAEARSLAAILVRRAYVRGDGAFTKLQPQTQAAVKTELTAALTGEQTPSIRKKVCDTVADLAVLLLGPEDNPSGTTAWPELFGFLFQCVTGADNLKEVALNIFAQIATYKVETLSPYLAQLHPLLSASLSAGAIDVRVAALRATVGFVQALESPADRDQFQNLIPAMVSTLMDALKAGDESSAQEALEMFVEVAGTEPRFLRKQLQPVCQAMLQIAAEQNFEEGVRHLAVEFIVTLCEQREKAPGMMRKIPQYIGELCNILLKMLLDIEDDPLWHTAEDEENEDAGNSDDFHVAQEHLDRLSCSLRGKTMLPAVTPSMNQLLAGAEWKHRHAALTCLAQIAEGCDKQLRKSTGEIADMLTSKFGDPHPRVRWAAVNATGQLCTDLGPEIQEEQHAKVLPALLAAMDDPSMRVAAHATAAMVNFSESCDKDLMQPYLDTLVSKLLQLLQHQSKLVKEGALTALASVADSAQDLFAKYYTTSMPYLKAILTQAHGKDMRMLRAKAMECISLVGMAVGKDVFRQDAAEVMGVLKQLAEAGEGGQTDSDDPTTGYMLQAHARICKTLGEEFVPYLPYVMPGLLKSAGIKPDVTVRDSNDEDDDEEDDDVETIDLGDKKISINTAVVEEKATACSMVLCYVEELHEHFYPYIETVAELMMPLIKFFFHDEVRKAAAQTLPELLIAAHKAFKAKKTQPQHDINWVRNMGGAFMKALMESVEAADESELLCATLESIDKCLGVLAPPAEDVAKGEEVMLLEPAQLEECIKQFNEVLTGSVARSQERYERSCTEDFDEEEREELQAEHEAESEVLDAINECIGTLAKALKSQLHPYFDHLLPNIIKLLSEQSSCDERRVAICIFDDIIEHTGEGGAANKYFQHFMPHFLSAAVNSHSDLRQAAVYGVGVCAEFGGAAFAPYMKPVVGVLNACVTAPDAREEDNAAPTENAISSLGKIAMFQRDAIQPQLGQPPEALVDFWLSLLPLNEDIVEARSVHALLVKRVADNDAAVLGANNKNLPEIARVFVHALSEGVPQTHKRHALVSDETGKEMVGLLKQLQGALPAEAFAAAAQGLDGDKQKNVQDLMSRL